MNYNQIVKKLKSLANPRKVEGMARYGINPKGTLGVSIYELRRMASKIGENHALALRLWRSGMHEARILASYIDEPDEVTEKQMEEWVSDFDSWDVCDQVCFLFEKTPFVYEKVEEWSKRREEFVKRTAFSLIAALSVYDKAAGDGVFKKFFSIIKREARDERNYVKKAVNWALRNIGKRNQNLNRMAIKIAKEIQKMDSKAARWIAANALRELRDKKIQNRLRSKKS